MSEATPVWTPNLKGRCPSRFIVTKTRVAVRLRNGREIDNPGWQAWSDRAAEATRWTLTGSDFDITHWKEIE